MLYLARYKDFASVLFDLPPGSALTDAVTVLERAGYEQQPDELVPVPPGLLVAEVNALPVSFLDGADEPAEDDPGLLVLEPSGDFAEWLDGVEADEDPATASTLPPVDELAAQGDAEQEDP